MSTWGSLLADIRNDLGDTGTTKRWDDDTLFLFARDAIREYSRVFPKITFRELITASSGAFPLPTNLIGIVSVESSEGVYLDRFDPKPGYRVRIPSYATAYYRVGNQLYLNRAPADGDTLFLTYKAIHDLPTSKDDTEAVLSTPTEDEELIRLFVKAKVSEQMRLKQSSLDRFKPGSGDRDDNPLLPEHNELMREYQKRVAERLGGVIHVHRAGDVYP